MKCLLRLVLTIVWLSAAVLSQLSIALSRPLKIHFENFDSRPKIVVIDDVAVDDGNDCGNNTIGATVWGDTIFDVQVMVAEFGLFILDSGHAPYFQTVSGTESEVRVDCKLLPPQQVIMLSFWDITGQEISHSRVRSKAIRVVDSINKWASMRWLGIRFGVHFSENRKSLRFIADDVCTSGECPHTDSIPSECACHLTGSINVYVVDDLTSKCMERREAGWGKYDIILLKSQYNWNLLLHEIGHCVGLTHCKGEDVKDGKCGCNEYHEKDNDNVMLPDDGNRTVIRVGQILRCHFHPISWLYNDGMKCGGKWDANYCRYLPEPLWDPVNIPWHGTTGHKSEVNFAKCSLDSP